ncbi:MAG: radical SAM/SPASM domain-containing protein [Bacteroidota bacterium]
MPVTAFRDARNLIKILTLKRVWNYIVLRLSYGFSVMFGTPVHAGKPSFISIEPANVCNLRCSECITGTGGFTRPQGMMSPHVFESALAAIPQETFYLNLYFQGEPYMNPSFFNFVLGAKKRKMYIAVSTNGHFLNDENIRSTVHSGIDRLIVSLDGADADTYTDYRRGGDFNKVVEGIKRLTACRNSEKSLTPFIVLQFLVSEKNQHQLALIQQLAKELGADKLELKTMQVLNTEAPVVTVPSDERYSRYRKNPEGVLIAKNNLPNRCFRMWSAPVICQNGDVAPCCYDKDAAHTMGNIIESNLFDIWKNPSYRAFRKRIFSNRKSVEMCRNCTEGSRYN